MPWAEAIDSSLLLIGKRERECVSLYVSVYVRVCFVRVCVCECARCFAPCLYWIQAEEFISIINDLRSRAFSLVKYRLSWTTETGKLWFFMFHDASLTPSFNVREDISLVKQPHIRSLYYPTMFFVPCSFSVSFFLSFFFFFLFFILYALISKQIVSLSFMCYLLSRLRVIRVKE